MAVGLTWPQLGYLGVASIQAATQIWFRSTI